MNGDAAQHLRDRYDGRPLLILLENYVLACIGARSEESTARIADVTRRAFGAAPEADWMEVLRTQLDLSPGVGDGIRARWQTASGILQEVGDPLDPLEFARGFVDANFTPLFDRIAQE